MKTLTKKLIFAVLTALFLCGVSGCVTGETGNGTHNKAYNKAYSEACVEIYNQNYNETDNETYGRGYVMPEHINSGFVINALCGGETRGRLAGSKDNRETENFLTEVFKKINLLPFVKENYKWRYSQTTYDPEASGSYAAVELSNRRYEDLVFGKDFVFNAGAGYINKYFAVTDIVYTDKAGEKFYAVIKDPAEWDGFREYGTDYFMAVEDRGLVVNPAPREDGDNVVIYISSEFARKINWDMVSGIYVKNNDSSEDKAPNNIIGYIKGKDSSKAVFVSAHFDAAGYNGGRYSQGAVDNASGVAALVSIAQKFAMPGVTPETDIVICAFNGEESGRAGSAAFVDEARFLYDECYNINIDCVGLKRGGDYSFGSSDRNSAKLIESFTAFLEANGVACNMDGGASSDHISFFAAGVPNICVYQESADIIHTVHDAKDAVDAEAVENIADIIYNFITENKINMFI